MIFDAQGTDPVSTETAIGLRLIIASMIAFLALLIVSSPTQITDPFVRHDDFPALLLIPELYYTKTLTEGRWINYLWHLRTFETPAWANYLLYQAGWSVFAGAVAIHVIGPRAVFYTAFLATLIVLAPQATMISAWFNTLLPGIWIIAAYAVIALYARPVWGIALLFPFVPISLMAYSTYPLLLLAVSLVRTDTEKNLWDLIVTVAVFAACFGLGLTLINSINYLVHGSYGIEIAEWRNPTPATDLPTYIDNLYKVERFLAKTFSFQGFGSPLIGVIYFCIFSTCLLILLRYRFMEALYLIAGVSIGFGLLAIHILSEGSVIAFRATLFSWVFFAVVVVKAAYICRDQSQRLSSLARIFVMFLTFTTSVLVWKEYRGFAMWQESTRAIGENLLDKVDTIYIYGPYMGIKGGLEAGIQDWRGLEMRLIQLTSAEVVWCENEVLRCAKHPREFDPAPQYGPVRIILEDNNAYLGLPAIEFAP